MSNNYTEEQINSLGITKLKDLVRDEKLKIKGAHKFKSDTKADLAEQVITKLMIQGRIISNENEQKYDDDDEDEQKYDAEGEAVNPEENLEKEKESRQDRIVKLMEEEEIQLDNSLDKMIPENRGSGKQTLTRMDLPSSQTMSGFMDAVKTGMPNISTGDLQKAKNAYQTVKKVYDQNEGNVGKTMSALALNYVPELKMLQSIGENIPYFGIDSEEKYQDLKKRMSGQPTALGGGSEAFFKSVGQLLLNPASTIRLAGDGIEYLAEETYDLFTKNKEADKTKAERSVDTGGNQARNLSQKRIGDLEKTVEKEKRLADAKGLEYKPDDTTTTSTNSLRKPQTSDFQVSLGSDTTVLDTSAYNKATKKYEEDKRRTLRSKDTAVDRTDFRLRDDLAQYVDSILESHKASVKSGKSSMSDEELEDLIDISESLRDKDVEITYRNLAQIKGDIDSNVDKSILDSENVKIKRGAFDYLEDTMLKGQSKGEADLRVDKGDDYNEIIDTKRQRDEQIEEQKIDDFNREVITSRAELTSNGYVNTDNHGRSELRPRIPYGNTDAELFPTQKQTDFSNDFVNTMSMWPQLETQDNKLTNILFQRRQDQQKIRYGKTFAVPNQQDRDLQEPDARTVFPNISNKKQNRSYNQKRNKEIKYYNDLNRTPESFIRLSNRELIPVFAPKSESELMIAPELLQFPFTQIEPGQDTSISLKKEKQLMPNRFPERVLRGYGNNSLPPAIRPSRKFNPWMNQNYIE